IQEPVKKGARTLKMSARLPLAQEAITRTMTLLDGENVVYVNTEVENLLAVDRPLSWAEHATVGPPFLLPGQTVIDIAATNCRVRAQKAGSTGKLAYGKDFVWPLAPLAKGGTVDLTTVPSGEASQDLAACRTDPARANAYITALRPDKHLIFGYVFRREEYPWVMSWMNYTGNARAARGFEFSTQPFDIPHRETVDAHEMFGTPTYKWLPAKAKLHSSFLFFYARTPDGFASVADVKLENGHVQILDKSGHTITLNATRSL
ncbi:MAG: aldose 1-epimerase family protein, partial [Acidobacteriota bacterium]|nr:aldose 1-epimerase family protein [Acidobacteriota bacterium]